MKLTDNEKQVCGKAACIWPESEIVIRGRPTMRVGQGPRFISQTFNTCDYSILDAAAHSAQPLTLSCVLRDAICKYVQTSLVTEHLGY